MGAKTSFITSIRQRGKSTIMTLDIFFVFLISAAVGCAAVYGIIQLKGVWILGALLYIAGGIIAFLTAHIIFWPLVADTHSAFIPGSVGFCIWSVLFFRLVLQHIVWSRKNQPISHP